jgi:hypothetical protein
MKDYSGKGKWLLGFFGLLLIGVMLSVYFVNKTQITTNSKADVLQDITDPSNPLEFEASQQVAVYDQNLIPDTFLQTADERGLSKNAYNTPFIYRQPNWSLDPVFAKTLQYYYPSPLTIFGGSVQNDLSQRRKDFLKKYFRAFYAPLNQFPSLRQRANIDINPVFDEANNFKDIQSNGSALSNNIQVINAQVLSDAGFKLQVLVDGNINGSYVNKQGVDHLLDHQPLTDDGVNQMVSKLEVLQNVITENKANPRLTFIYGNEENWINKHAGGENVITPGEYWNSYYKLKLAAAKKGIIVEPNALAAIENFQEWADAKWEVKAQFLRSANEGDRNILYSDDPFRLNLYEKNAVNFINRYENTLKSHYLRLNNQYSGEFGRDIIEGIGFQEVGILLNDPGLAGSYDDKNRVRRSELPKIIRYLRDQSPSLTEISLFTWPFSNYCEEYDGETCISNNTLATSNLKPDWDGDIWDIFSEPDLLEAVKNTY